MKINSALRLIAGVMILISIILQVFHSPDWIYFTAFIAVNLTQSAFTNWCPMMFILGKFGLKE